MTGTRPFTGGNDVIILSNVVVTTGVSADAYFAGSLPSFNGGNDSIFYSYDRTDNPANFWLPATQ